MTSGGIAGRGPHDEQGAVLMLVVFLTVTLIGMAALVVDVGALLDEHRQLQNGADAGALAVARSCAQGACDTSLAENLADANSRDGDSVVDSVSYPTANRVRVTTSTHGGSGSILPYAFGQILTGVKGKTQRATATAAWTNPAPATAIGVPIAVSQCEANQLVVGTYVVIRFTTPLSTCLLEYPSGNFGWLDAECPDTFTIGMPAGGDPGKSGPKKCLDTLINTDVSFPVYDTVSGSGRNTLYGIVGFAVLRLTGWRFPGDPSPTPPCGSGATCVAGTVVRSVTTGAAGVSLVS